jgi:hypothetical protein
MNLDVGALAETMTAAAREAVAGRWPLLQSLAEMEFRRIAQSLEDLGRLVAAGDIEESRARKLAYIHQVTVRSVFTTVEGLGLYTAERAIHAAIRAVANVVNGAVKFTLL